MVRRRYRLLLRYSHRLTRQLQNIATWARGNRDDPDVLKKAIGRAKMALDNHFNLLVPYVYRTRVQRDLGRRVKSLGEAELEKLEKLKSEYLTQFASILDDALRS